MSIISMKALLESGVHFGHRTHKWNPAMKQYIFTERNGIHIIDLQKTVKAIEHAFNLVRDTVAEGGTVLFVGTKRQAQEMIQTEALRCGMPYVTDRWLGGMLTNWRTIRQRINEMERIERMRDGGDFERITKKEALILSRKLERLEVLLGGIRKMVKVPDLLFVVDDTASMAQEQVSLAARFSTLADDLDAADVSWQVGAVRTSMQGEQAGWLQGSPWILTPDIDDRGAAFADMVQVGTKGSSPEAGLAAAIEALALSVPGEANAGFRRPDALLHVVFVSDADDHSQDLLGADPVGAFLEVLAAEAEATGLPARASGLVGDVPSGCSSASGTAQPAFRYTEAVEGAQGVTTSICAVDFGPFLASLAEASLSWQTTFELSGVPEAGTLRVEVGGEAVGGWTLDGTLLDLHEPPGPEAVVTARYLVRND